MLLSVSNITTVHGSIQEVVWAAGTLKDSAFFNGAWKMSMDSMDSLERWTGV